MIEKDCNTCRHHIQEDPVRPFCWSCLTEEPVAELPRWEPRLDSYLDAIAERHPEETMMVKDGISVLVPHPQVVNQSRKESLIEATLNTLSGFLVSFGLWLFVVAPLFGIESNPVESFWITCLFTVVSVARSYVWRRLFVNKFFLETK